MIKTFQSTDRNELDNIINFYLETDHFEILEGSYDVIKSDDGRLYSLTLSSKPYVVVNSNYIPEFGSDLPLGKILRSWSTSPEKGDEGLRWGNAFYYSPMMDNKVMLEFEVDIKGGGPYVEWFDDGEIKRYIEYEDDQPIMCLQWHNSNRSVNPAKKSRSIDVNGIIYGEKQQIELIGYYEQTPEDYEDLYFAKHGEWIVFDHHGDIRFKGNYDYGKLKGDFNYDPLPDYESSGDDRIQSAVEHAEYYIDWRLEPYHHIYDKR